jgi:polysaccharide deacetylase 2 family uncharacterized protein YibQ
MTKPVDDDIQDNRTRDTDENGDAVAAQPKPSRFVLVVWAFVVLFALYIVIGTGIAFFSNHIDPSVISIPSAPALEPLPEPVKPDVVIPFPMEEGVDEKQHEESPVTLPAAVPVVVPSVPDTVQLPVETPPEPKLAPQSALEPVVDPVLEPAVIAAPRPQIAIMIDDMGLNMVNSRRMVALSAPLTLAYLPYAENIKKQTTLARQNGHELWVHMPMEPTNMKGNNPGPNALLTTNTPDENMRRLNENLARFDGYTGINNHMGSRFTRDRAALAPVMAEIKKRGLWFLDSKTIGSSVAGDMAVQAGVAAVTRDVFLDNVMTLPAINAQLRVLENTARRKGYAVAIGHPHDATVAALETWTRDAAARGFDIVPLSEIIARRFPTADIPLHAMTTREDTIMPAAGMENAHMATMPILNAGHVN